MSTIEQPRVVTCGGATTAARRAERVARALTALGVGQLARDEAAEDDPATATIVVDGCASACGLRRTAASDTRVVAAVSLDELLESATDLAPSAAAARILALVGDNAQPSHPGRPPRPLAPTPPRAEHAHTAEDYLLTIDRLASPAAACGAQIIDAPTLAAHVSEALGVSRPSAGEMLAKLEAAGLVHRGARKELTLTVEGREEADACVRRQRLLEIFVTETLGFDAPVSYGHARRLSAGFDDEAIDRLEQSLGRPERCPHGWPVDPVQARRESHALRSLASLEVGDTARVARMLEDDEATLVQLAALGIGLDARVTSLGELADGHRLRSGRRTVVVDREVAATVFVRAT
jgi:DtxR family Mn-dependent transcriptional regulator